MQTSKAVRTQKKPPLPTIPPIAIPRIFASFLLRTPDGVAITCDVYDAHAKTERAISTETLINRGRAVSADMGRGSGQLLFRHRDQIPEDLQPFSFIFPLWSNDGLIRAMNYQESNPWWCHMKLPEELLWSATFCLVRLQIVS